MSQTTEEQRVSHHAPLHSRDESTITLDLSPESIELPASPELAASDRVMSAELGADSANTDSMVTIRLSSVPSASRKSVTFSPLTATTPFHEAGHDSDPAEHHEMPDEEDASPQPDVAEKEHGEKEKLKVQTESVDAAPTKGPESTAPGSEEEEQKTPSRPSSGSHASLKANTMSTATVATVEDFEASGLELKRVSSRSSLASSTGSVSSTDSAKEVDWEQLDKNEEAEVRDQATDESTAFLLARLERENQLLSLDPKAQVNKARIRGQSRPPSLQQIKKLANEPSKKALRYSLLPNPPPMTELEFWSALVRDYAQTAQRLPTLTSNKIRSGIPPPLRGVVWVSIAGARDPNLEEEYERLCGESSPYEKLIGKDIGRSFPGVDMFRDPDGDGQKMLGKVLNAYSLWDEEIGYCQGLGFVVGPLIMHMSDKDAFCVLVKLMQSYDLRNCFLPDLSGLKMRIFQFQNLLRQHLPILTEHLDNLKVEPLYVSQWFLSFFGVNCPLPMLIRIYDILLTEGASETLMRVALSLMRRNEEKILALTEFEDVMGLLLSRGLWDTYNFQADDLVNDFVGWTGLVTRDGLHDLEAKFKEQSKETSEGKNSQKVESAAARFLGRFWASSSPTTSPTSKSAASPTLATPTQSEAGLKRTPSKQSMASTLNSIESIETVHSQSTAATDSTRLESVEFSTKTSSHVPKPSMSLRSPTINKDRDLHSQIEDLLMAMNDLQREQAMLANELQREREERDEDRAIVTRAVDRLRKRKTLEPVPEEDKQNNSDDSDDTVTEDPITELETHFASSGKVKRSSLTLQTKLQLRDEVNRWKTQYNDEVARSTSLSSQLTERERESKEVRDQLRDARSRIADSHRDMQRLEKTNRDLRDRSGNTFNSPRASIHSIISNDSSAAMPKASGLRELKLGRAATSTSGPAASNTSQAPAPAPAPQVFNRRVSSLSMQNVLATEDHKPLDQETLLLELVNAKTAEAVAKQELEEVKGKLDALRKMVSSNAASSGMLGHTAGSLSVGNAMGLMRLDDKKKEEKAEDKKTAAPVSSGGWFSGGWGKRAVSGTGS